MTSSFLSKGQNIELPEAVSRVDILISWVDDTGDVDASALLLVESGKVSTDADFVFYNQPESSDGAVRHLGRSAAEDGLCERISIDLALLDPRVLTVALAGSVTGRTFGDLGKLSLRVIDGAGMTLGEYVTADAREETAFVFGEVYQRSGRWKLRAVGQGWTSGLEGLATDFGVSVENDDVPDSDAVAESVVDADADGSVSIDTTLDTDSNDSAPPTCDGDMPTAAASSESVAVVDESENVAQLAPPPKPRGVRTTKAAPKKAKPFNFALADGDNWAPARLFSVVGVGSGDEQERRATAALIATMQAVKPFARAISGRVGAPAGRFEGYVEVPYTKGETKVIPDAVLRVARGSKMWTALLEVKTGTGELRRDQLENYLDVARRHKYDVVVSLSNDVPPGVGDLPVEVDRRKLAKVDLRHLSWTDVVHEARMLLAHGGIEDGLEAWILTEFVRYLAHPRSGAADFVDMGPHWVTVRDSIAAGTLRAGDKKVSFVADKWLSLSRYLSQRLTAELGVPVRHVLPRRLVNDPTQRTAFFVDKLASEGTLDASFRVPETAGDLDVSVDLRANRVTCQTTVTAPDEGSTTKRLSWIMKQLGSAPEDLLVEAVFSEHGVVACETLATVRATPKALTEGRQGHIVKFSLTRITTMGSKRSGTASGFVTSVTAAVDVFYTDVLQTIREWVPAAPEPVDPPESWAAATL
ncbi:TerD family protein [Rhodococcus sp. MEB064]|uniref:TerD family protein n=1 Tax=Rhodococcus sp. MEB064 TaxID=1587522 RepID=UPI0005AC4D20|nr:TerD family protein [Rhodococcus sp. MEB064]KIQ20469.1 stress protein [Rhodococcus sp. MEB064]